MDLLESIASLPEVSFKAGSDVITPGKRPDRLFFLQSGRVEVIRDGIRVAVVKSPGSVLGELSLLLDTPAKASVVALEDSVFHVADNPIEFLASHPQAHLHVSRTLACRLDAATRYLVDVREQLGDCSDHVGMLDGVLDAILHRDLKRKISGEIS